MQLYSSISHLLRSLVIVGLCGFSQSGIAQTTADGEREYGFMNQLYHYLTDGASITVGIGGRQSSVTVTRIDTQDNGKLVENDDAWFLSYNTRASYFQESKFGYSWMFNLSSFSASHQETAPKVVEDLGTSVDGYFAYVVPTIFYNFGDLHQGTWFRVGVGLGLGITEFEGDIILTNSDTPNDRVAISNGPSKIYFAGGVYLEGQIDYFTFRVATAGPGFQYDGYKINIGDTSVMLGYTHYFGW